MNIRFSGVTEIRFVTGTGKPLPKKDLVNIAFHWEQEAPRAREAFVLRGRVLNLNDQDEFDRRTHRKLVNNVLSEKVHVRLKKTDTLEDAADRLPAKARTGLKRSTAYAMLRSFEEDCLARFEESHVKFTQTVTATQHGPDDVTFSKQS